MSSLVCKNPVGGKSKGYKNGNQITGFDDKYGVKYVTSGARGLVDNMTDFVYYVYTKGFLQYL